MGDPLRGLGRERPSPTLFQPKFNLSYKPLCLTGLSYMKSITFRPTEAALKALESLMSVRGLNRSQAINAALEASAEKQPLNVRKIPKPDWKS